MLVALSVRRRLSLTRAFYLGLTTGGVFFAGTLYWITNVMAFYGGMSTPVAVLVNALLVAYMAIYTALFAVVFRRLVQGFGARALIAAPLVWVATELGRTHLLGGFPWVLLGYSQATTLPVAQLASLFGVYGVSGLVASVSAAAAGCMATNRTRARVQSVGAVAVLLIVTAVWGSWRAARAEWTREGQAVTVGLIQGNASEAQRRDPTQALQVFQIRCGDASGHRRGAELVLWSESAMSLPLRRQPGSRAVRRVAQEGHVDSSAATKWCAGARHLVRGGPAG